MGYQGLPTVSQNPVVQQSQYCLGQRWWSNMAEEDDLDNRENPDDPRDGEADLRADRGPEATMVVSTNRTVTGGGPEARPITTETHEDRFPTQRGRGRAQPMGLCPVFTSCARSSGCEIAAGVFDAAIRGRRGVGRCRHVGVLARPEADRHPRGDQ
jgi:hypothetical protein